jgi:hypothetical protein
MKQQDISVYIPRRQTDNEILSLSGLWLYYLMKIEVSFFFFFRSSYSPSTTFDSLHRLYEREKQPLLYYLSD